MSNVWAMPLGGACRRLTYCSRTCCANRSLWHDLMPDPGLGGNGAGILDGAEGPERLAVSPLAARLLLGSRQCLCCRTWQHASRASTRSSST